MGMLHTRYNKDGAKVLVEKENLEVFEKLGYELREMPKVEEVSEKVVESSVEAPVEKVPEKKEAEVVKKPVAKRGRKPKVEKDIVLD